MRKLLLALICTAVACSISAAQESADLAACKSSSSQQPKPDNRNYASHIRGYIEQVNIPACGRVIADRDASRDDRIVAYHRRANYLASLGRFDKARADVNELMKLDPKRADTHILRASLLRRQKRGSDALASLTKSIGSLPGEPGLLIERGRLHDAFKRFDEALEDFSKAVKIATAPEDLAEARMARGRIHSRMGKLEEAVEDYSAAIELDKRPEEQGFAYTNRAEAFLYLKQRDKAAADLRTMMEITQPDHPARMLANILAENIERQNREQVDEKR